MECTRVLGYSRRVVMIGVLSSLRGMTIFNLLFKAFFTVESHSVASFLLRFLLFYLFIYFYSVTYYVRFECLDAFKASNCL